MNRVLLGFFGPLAVAALSACMIVQILSDTMPLTQGEILTSILILCLAVACAFGAFAVFIINSFCDTLDEIDHNRGCGSMEC